MPVDPSARGRLAFAHALLFTGHMIDAPERKEPRFPARVEGRARQAMRDAVLALRRDSTVGVAGGASGGDLLFHEVCADLEIPTRLRLALPAQEFVAASVAPAGAAWVRRFEALVARLGPENVRVMSAREADVEGETINIWQRANLWMIEEVLTLAPERTLVALWDGKGGDGPGGTEHLLRMATEHGIRVAPLIHMQALLD